MLGRTEENGSLQFHQGTEDLLAEYVITHSQKGNPDSIIKAIDEFCWHNHWMMHVGDKKGEILDNILKKHHPKIILELGTYCGYSAIRMAKSLPVDGKIYTIDPKPTDCCRRLIDHAQLTDKIICLTGLAQNVIPLLDDILKNKVDLCFIDHAKAAYCPDLILIETSNLFHRGSVVVADNVIIFKIDDYLDHVKNSGLYSSSETFLSTLEYDDSELKERIDGIEVSIWK